ncbi:hypothetical protein ALC57_01185 [Trachymyrmex cornetzi]|uniref:DNA-directed DNA polymerase n=1 Tax=Trachymyrmex cornetzi TaxID=471704 RepID=A0A151JQ68_9HYME|nr:hypothetical protein ALC57_01185 [Trachymyrmex cornetzi]
MENHERVERELLEQCGQMATMVECFAWLQRCDECIERLEELCLTGAVINSNHIEPCRFLEDAGNIVLEPVRDAVERHDSVKVNTAFNGEFATKDKRANKSIITKNSEIYRCTDLHECQKLQTHEVDCQKLNDCAFRLPSENDRWLEFSNHRNQERVPFVVYADLECILRKMKPNKIDVPTSYAYQRHEAFSKDKNEKNFQKNCIKLRFIDSYKFLNTSLDKLASYLDKDKLKIVRFEFSTLSDEEIELLTRKCIFPHEYIDCVEKLQDTRLPSRELFFSSLTGDTVSESDYAHAVNVWQRFSIRTLGEYSDLYLKTDVLLLADIFENFRNSCVASHGLDPAHYYTLPGFTWDPMLKHTRVRFELLTDIDMVMFIERGIHGGLSQCSDRYAQANNKYMRSYDSSKPSSYLMYYDVNNLYGWAMCQPLPYAEFRWVEDAANFDVSAIAPNSSTGYIEVDLEYPQRLHDRHSDLPFCPMRDKPPGKREDKLLATLYDKQRYVIHYRNLQQCTRHGLRVTKIHRVSQFAQFAWLRDYIELNT